MIYPKIQLAEFPFKSIIYLLHQPMYLLYRPISLPKSKLMFRNQIDLSFTMRLLIKSFWNKILDRIGNRLMGLYGFTSVGSFPDFRTRTISATFQWGHWGSTKFLHRMLWMLAKSLWKILLKLYDLIVPWSFMYFWTLDSCLFLIL